MMSAITKFYADRCREDARTVSMLTMLNLVITAINISLLYFA